MSKDDSSKRQTCCPNCDSEKVEIDLDGEGGATALCPECGWSND